MFSTLLGGLSAYKNMALAAGLALLLAFAGTQSVRLRMRTLELDACKATAAKATADFKSAISAQNAGIEAVKVATFKAIEAGTKANVIAIKTIAAAEAKAVAIEKTPAPADCDAAIKFLVQEAGRE